MFFIKIVLCQIKISLLNILCIGQDDIKSQLVLSY